MEVNLHPGQEGVRFYKNGTAESPMLRIPEWEGGSVQLRPVCLLTEGSSAKLKVSIDKPPADWKITQESYKQSVAFDPHPPMKYQ
jgi:hypothetical protein